MAREQSAYPLSGARTIFNGVNAETVFAAQTVPLPELSPGEILAKVIKETQLFSELICTEFRRFALHRSV